MAKLTMLYWGTVFLMYLSQIYYPTRPRLSGQQTGKHSFMWRKADIFMALTIAWMTCFSFLRTSYNDTGNYIGMFYNAPSVDEFIAEGGLLDLTGNPLSYFYEAFMSELTENYHIYFFFPAFVSSFAVVKLFKRYSVDPLLSLIVFYSIGTYVMYIAALKQCLAMFFLLMALPYAIEKKYVKFYLLVFVAILFHTHAFMFAIVPFLTGKPWGKRMWLLLFAALFAMATYNTTMGAFMNFAQSIGALVADIEVFDGHQINVLRVLVYWVPALLAWFFRRQLFRDSTPMENLFVNMSLVSAFILMIGLINGANLYARMAAYFELAAAVALPWIIHKLATPQSVKIISATASMLYFGYFLYEHAISKSFNTEFSAISLWQFFISLFQ